MEELDLEMIKKRSVRGVFALTSRTLFLQVISFLAIFLLTIFLAPEVFGVFFVVSAIVAFLGYFSDIGLAAALIQKKEALTKEDLKTTFTIQQVLVLTIVILAFVFSEFVTSFYHLDSAGLWLFRALVISFFLASLKTIPSVILERRLDFNRLIIPQIGETLLYSFIAVILAWKGFGIQSFTWAVLARGLSGLILIYLLAPWRPALGINKDSARSLLHFGFPFQMNSFLALLKDDLLTAFLGKILPMAQVGFVGWGQKWAFMPLRLLIDNVGKVTFPAYARLQESPDELKKAIEKSLFFIALLGFPLFVGLCLLAKPLVLSLPNYQKWEPALFSLYLFSFNAVWAAIVVPLINTLNATGRVKTTLKIMLGLTITTWVLTPLFVFRFGYNGVAMVSALLALSGFLVVFIVKKIIPVNILRPIFKPAIISLGMGVLIFFFLGLRSDLLGILLAAFLGGLFYLAAAFFWTKEEVLPIFKKFFLPIFSQRLKSESLK